MYISHVAQVNDTAQVTRQVSLLGLNAREQGRNLVNKFLVQTITVCIQNLIFVGPHFHEFRESMRDREYKNGKMCKHTV